MKITIEGAKQLPTWETLQHAVREIRGDELGKFVRISRKDRSCDYRAHGEYSVDYRTDAEDIVTIELSVK